MRAVSAFVRACLWSQVRWYETWYASSGRPWLELHSTVHGRSPPACEAGDEDNNEDEDDDGDDDEDDDEDDKEDNDDAGTRITPCWDCRSAGRHNQ